MPRFWNFTNTPILNFPVMLAYLIGASWLFWLLRLINNLTYLHTYLWVFVDKYMWQFYAKHVRTKIFIRRLEFYKDTPMKACDIWKLDGHSVERMYLRQRPKSENLASLTPRSSATVRRREKSTDPGNSLALGLQRGVNCISLQCIPWPAACYEWGACLTNFDRSSTFRFSGSGIRTMIRFGLKSW